jgi:hypothetical protein
LLLIRSQVLGLLVLPETAIWLAAGLIWGRKVEIWWRSR